MESPRLRCVAVALLCAAALAGCSGSKPREAAPAEGAAAVADPYLRNRTEVPAAAQSALE